MDYKVSYAEIHDFYNSYTSNCFRSNRSSLLQKSLPNAVNEIINSDGISGTTANRMRSYMRDVHIPILSMLVGAMQLLTADMLEYQMSYAANVDAAADTRVKAEELAALKKDILGLQGRVSDIDAQIKDTLKLAAQADYSPETVGGYPGVDNIIECCGKITSFVEALDTRIIAMETQWPERVRSDFYDMLSDLSNFIRENTGHSSVYIATYKPSYRTKRYYDLQAHNRIVSDYISQNKEQIKAWGKQIADQEYKRNAAEIQEELGVELEKSAAVIRVIGTVGDAALTTGSALLTCMGCPALVTGVVSGSAKSAWSTYYAEIAEGIENYNIGKEMVNEEQLTRDVAFGSIKGGVRGLITSSLSELGDLVGEIGFIDSLSDSNGFLGQLSSGFFNITISTLEDRTGDILGNMTDRYFDTLNRQISEGSDYQGLSPLEAMFDKDAIMVDVLDSKEFKKSITKSWLSESFSDLIKYHDSKIKTPEALEKTHSVGRVLKKGAVKATETATGEILGEILNEDSAEAAKERLADEELRRSLFGKTVGSFFSAGLTEWETIEDEKDIIAFNRKYRRVEYASEASGTNVPTDKYGNPDYSKALYSDYIMYKDEKSGKKAKVTIDFEKSDDYDSIVSRAEKEYGKKLGRTDFKTPEGYHWVAKFDQTGAKQYDGYVVSRQQVTLQLVLGDAP